jgi:peptidoglycan/xylan/chitin deacetylase (PgdA/CDA1 family)
MISSAANFNSSVIGSGVAQLLFFWDYDTQWGADRSRGADGPKNWGYAEFENTERLLELHGQYDIPACFAVVGAAALGGQRPYHDPEQIRRIHAAGHEIASHSHRHEWLPGLSRAKLLETLRCSKDALEQCIGASVVSFVPPFNQPFDYPRRWSISLSERREAGRQRVGIKTLCDALLETRYQFCRVAYRPIYTRCLESVLRRRIEQPVRPENIAGITCLRLNTRCGFSSQLRQTLTRQLREGGMWVIYGHPHSTTNRDTPQALEALEEMLALVRKWKYEGSVDVTLPRDIVRFGST